MKTTSKQKAKIILVTDNSFIIFISRPGSNLFNQGIQYSYNQTQEWLLNNASNTDYPELCAAIGSLGFGDSIEMMVA